MADFLTSTDGIINGALTKSWKIVLSSTNGALKFVNFDPGDLLTLVVQEDASGSNYTLTFPSSVLWQAKAAPNRDTTASAVSVYTFSYDGTNFRDTGGTSKGLPSKIVSAVLGTIVGAGVVATIFVSSNGNGGHTGPSSPDILNFKNGTGASAVTVGKVNNSGALVLGQSGALVVGSTTLNQNGLDSKFFVNRAGAVTARSTMSGAKLAATPTSGTAALVLYGTAKGSHFCVADSDGVGWTEVSYNNGTATSIVAPAGECP